jgi:hypothetical protein
LVVVVAQPYPRSEAAGPNLEQQSEKLFCVEWMCTQERWNPDVVNIYGAAARYHRATFGDSHDGAHPDNSTLHTGKIYSVPLHISRAVLLLLRQRRAAVGAA